MSKSLRLESAFYLTYVPVCEAKISVKMNHLIMFHPIQPYQCYIIARDQERKILFLIEKVPVGIHFSFFLISLRA